MKFNPTKVGHAIVVGAGAISGASWLCAFPRVAIAVHLIGAAGYVLGHVFGKDKTPIK